MKNVKLLVFDVGNTLIETKRGLSISNQVLCDLNALKDIGCVLGLSTLRTQEMLSPILAQFQFDFLVLMNGGLVTIGDRVVFSQPLETETVNKIKQQAAECNATVIDYSHNGQIYALELPAAKGRFSIGDSYQAYVWDYSGNIDITPKGITKLHGIRIVCRELDISPEEIVAFGDGYNDIDMLKMAGLSVAMGDAPDEVCNVATITTTTAHEDGISKALRKLEIL